MKHNSKKTVLISVFACLCALALVLVGCGGSSNTDSADTDDTTTTTTDGSYSLVTEGKIISVSDMECPPFSSYKDGTSEPEGFEIDLMAAVAEKMGLESEWLPKMDFDAIIPLIKQGGKADVGVANFTITDERKKEIDFSDPYYIANIGFVTKADTTATSIDDFNEPRASASAPGRHHRRGLGQGEPPQRRDRHDGARQRHAFRAGWRRGLRRA